jgi:peptidoglycan/LPS O-acetylase OafA/YrhL
MLVAIPFAWVLLSPFELNSFSKSLTAVPLFLSNFFFWKDGGYFETAAELKPLLHTWSLAVEEQYYVFFPIFLILFWKLGRRFVLITIVFLGILSLVTAQCGSIYKPVANFFLLPSRIWELAIGSAIAFYLNNKTLDSKLVLLRQFFSCLGFLFIIASIFLFDEETPFPSVYALLPTVGAALILLYALPDTYIGKILASKFLVFVGLISYSAYIWHQPVLAFSRYYFSSISTYLSAFLIIIIFLLSVFTWRYIERPFRNKSAISGKFIFIFSLVCSLFFVTFGYASSKLFSSSSSYGIESRTAKALASADAVYASNMDERKFIKFRISYESLSPNAIVFGSSRIMQIGEHNFPNKILNLGVSGASVEDDLAIVDLATKKFNPKILFIAVDPWLFNKNSGQGSWMSLNDEYVTALSTLNVRLDKKYALTEANKETLLLEIGSKIYTSISNQVYVANNDLPESRDKIRRDGSRVYNTTYANKTQKEISVGFDDLLNYAMTDYFFSKTSQELFGRFVDSYSQKYNVVLVLSPYHPKLYERMRRERPIYLEIESNFRVFAKTHNVAIIGSYNPENLGCNESEFYDGMHPKGSCMGKVMKTFLKNNLVVYPQEHY